MLKACETLLVLNEMHYKVGLMLYFVKVFLYLFLSFNFLNVFPFCYDTEAEVAQYSDRLEVLRAVV